jgi:lipopolysaccharide transport system permease protein
MTRQDSTIAKRARERGHFGLLAPYLNLWRHRRLAVELTRQQISARYSGAFLGLFWTVLLPLLYLSVFTFVFTVIFPRHWPVEQGQEIGRAGFALLIFTGLIVFWLFSDCTNAAPELLRKNENYVKNVVFPIDILAWANLGEALFHTCIRVLLLALAVVVLQGHVVWTSLFLPFVWLPFILIILGISWILARFGVFVRDLGLVIGPLMIAALFLSAVFYSTNSIPLPYRDIFLLNPIAFTIEQTRNVLVWGLPPNWLALVGFGLGGLVLVWLGWQLFTRARGKYSDVL